MEREIHRTIKRSQISQHEDIFQTKRCSNDIGHVEHTFRLIGDSKEHEHNKQVYETHYVAFD